MKPLAGTWPEAAAEGPTAGRPGTDAREGEALNSGEPIAHRVVRADTAPRLESAPRRALTELGNAERLVDRHGADLRYVHAFGRWLVWDGRSWRPDADGSAARCAIDVIRNLAADAVEADDENRTKILRHALRSENDRAIRGMLSIASNLPGIPVPPDALDADPWLLGVASGVIDLRTGKLRPHDRRDLITKLSPVAYDPDAKAPTWEASLRRWLDDRDDLIEFVRRFVGYCLTGDTREQVLVIAYGSGANGKSTFERIVREMLGDYGQTAPPELLLERRDGVPNDVARLKGARFVSIVETGEGRRLNEAVVKRLTGGDAVAARFMRGEFFEFVPIAKYLMATNHKPDVRGTDEAIWRRIRLVPFTTTILEDERDPRLVEKLRRELPGILAWAVAGCLEWQEHGLTAPASVKQATNEYRAEQDTLGAFIAEACTLGETCGTTAGALYDAYLAWAREVGERSPLSKRALGLALPGRGFHSARSNNQRLWIGLEPTEARHNASSPQERDA